MPIKIIKKGVKYVNATHPKLNKKQDGILDLTTEIVKFSDGTKVPKSKLLDLSYPNDVQYD